MRHKVVMQYTFWAVWGTKLADSADGALFLLLSILTATSPNHINYSAKQIYIFWVNIEREYRRWLR